MLTPEILEFARLLMQEVRDKAIRNCDIECSSSCRAVTAKRLRKARAASVDKFAEMLAMDAVDNAIFYLLNAIDNAELRLHFVAKNGKVIDLTEVGESGLAGWPAGSDGWHAEFSKERYIDDFAEIAAGVSPSKDGDDDDEADAEAMIRATPVESRNAATADINHGAMLTPEILEFAKILMQQVRDNAIGNCDVKLHPRCRSAAAKRLRRAKAESVEAFAAMLAADAVDAAIFFLLDAIDNEHLRLHYVAKNGKVVDLAEVGESELGGWFMGSDGWRAEFSKERYIDDFADPAAGISPSSDEEVADADDETDTR